MCLKLKCFGYSCKKAWRGEGRDIYWRRRKHGKCFILFLFCFFFVFFFWGGGGRRRAGEEYFEASEKFECLGSRKISPQKVLPYSLDITPPSFISPPFHFARICCEGIFISNLSPPRPRKNSATPTNERKVRTHRTTLYRV